MSAKSLNDQLAAIELLIRFAAPEEHRQQAQALVHHYRDDQVALRLLHHFYSYLPEAEDDAVQKISEINSRQGIFLLVAVSLQGNYLYLVNTEEAAYLGTIEEHALDEELLEFFGWQEEAAFTRAIRDVGSLEDYKATVQDGQRCPACSVSAGEEHIMGCPVEICPWCGGQLVHCNCRFTRLHKEKLDGDHDLDELFRQLSAKGRIPFAPQGQTPAYLSLAEHLARKKT
jgi:hypothetical protein